MRTVATTLKKKAFPLKRVILGGVILLVGIIVAVFVIKNANAGLGEVVIPEGADTQNTYFAKPDEGTPTDVSAIDSLFIAAGVLRDAGSFSAESEGTSTSMGVSQGIRSTRTVLGEKAFKEVVTHSAFVKMGEQRYYNGSDYLIRGSSNVSSTTDVTWGDSITPLDRQAYLLRYGYIPNQMTSYILNTESIESGELVSEDNGLYTFHYTLNIDLAPVNLLYEMRTSAGTSNYPKFLSADIMVVMDGDWKVSKVSTSCKYEVALLGGVTCEESMTETFTQIGGITELPETAFFSPYFGSETTDKIETAPDAISVMTGVFGEYIEGAPLNAELVLSAPGTALDGMTALVSLGLDIENLENITADVRVGGIDVSYRNGRLYLGYGEFKGSLTTDGLMSAINEITELLNVSMEMPEIDIDALLGGLTLTETERGVEIGMSAGIAGLSLDAKIVASKAGESYALTEIVIALNDYTVTATPCEAWEPREFKPEECPDILGLLDVLKGGVVSFTAEINGIGIDVQYDIKNNVLNAFVGDITVALRDETVYIAYNNIKLKLKLTEIGTVLDDLAPVLDALGLNLDLSSLSETEIDIESILNSLVVTSDGSKAVFALNVYGFDLSVNLNNAENRWTIGTIEGAYGDIALTARPSVAKPFVGIEDSEYVNVTALTGLLNSILSEPINLELNIGGVRAYVRVTLDLANLENTAIDVCVGGIDLAYRNGRLYLGYGEFKGSLTTDGLMSAINEITALLNVSMEMPEIDIDALLGGLTLTETERGVEIGMSAGIAGLSLDAKIVASKAGESYALTEIVIALNDYTITATPCEAWEPREFKPEECPDILGLLDVLKGGVVSFTAEINGIGIDVQYDIKNNVLNAFVGDITVALRDETVYIAYNNIKLKLRLTEIGTVFDDLAPVLDALGLNLDLSSLSETEIDIESILNSLVVTSDGSKAVFALNVYGFDLSVNLNNAENRWTIGTIEGVYGDITLTARPSVAKPFVGIEDSEYVDLAEVVSVYASPIAELIAAQGYAFDISLSIKSGGTVYGLDATVNFHGGLSVVGTVSINGMTAVALDVVYADGIVYLTVNGADFAFRVGSNGGSNVDIAELLGSLRGYNGTIDAIINDLLGVISVATDGLNVGDLLGGLSFDRSAGELLLTLCGGQFGLSDLAVTLNASDGIGLAFSDFVFGNVSFDVALTARASTAPVTAPEREYITNLEIRIDELNTLYVQLDTLNGIYRFRLDDLYGEFADGVISLHYYDVNLRGDINEIAAIVSALDDIVKEAQAKYAAGLLSAVAENTSSAGSDILKTLLNSLTLTANCEKGTLTLAFVVSGLPADITIACGDAPDLTVNVELLGKNITANVTDKEITYFEFGSVPDEMFVDITTVFNDYMGEFETLARANSWHFELSAEIELNGTKYLLAEGSSIELLYYTPNSFDLKATLRLMTWDGSKYINAYNIVAAYIDDKASSETFDGRIYVDYSNVSNNIVDKDKGEIDNHLKLTLGAESIAACADIFPKLLNVVPQIGELIDKMQQSQKDAMENLELVKYSSIIKAASYENGELGLVINAGVVLPALGDVDLTVSKGANGGLALSVGSLTYNDNAGIALALKNVSASVVAQSESQGAENIGEFSTDGYINLDSVRELLGAFVNTADFKRDQEGNPITQTRSFKLSGTANVSVIGILTVDVGLDVSVDIDEDGYVYLSFRLYREKLGLVDLEGAAFKDYGGYSYLNYNSKSNTFRMMRNSYNKYTWCSKCNKFGCSNGWHLAWKSSQLNLDTEQGVPLSYDSGEISAEQFSGEMIDNILKMVNFKTWIENQIKDALSGEGNGSVYGIEDVIKSYVYTPAAGIEEDAEGNIVKTEEYADGSFGVIADLTPIDGNLGVLELNIYHDENLSLTRLTGSMPFVGGIVKINLGEGIKLLTPTYGEAIDRVSNALIW